VQLCCQVKAAFLPALLSASWALTMPAVHPTPPWLQLRDACHAHNQAACQQLVGQLRESFGVLKARLEQFMQLERQRKQLGGS